MLTLSMKQNETGYGTLLGAVKLIKKTLCIIHTFLYRLFGSTLLYSVLRNVKNNGVESTGDFLRAWHARKKWIREWKRENRLSVNPASFGCSRDEFEERKTECFEKSVLISVVVPLYNTPRKYLRQMIDSVRMQTYGNWELCLADGSNEKNFFIRKYCEKLAKTDSRIKYKKLEKNLGISGNSNACLEMAAGDYIALLDHDDLLHPYALSENMKYVCSENADFIYSDENVFIKKPTETFCPHYKPDYAPDTLRSYNYICHFSVFSKELLNKVGGFRSEFDGSQDFDLFLRLTEKAEKIVHIPKILYYWRAAKSSTASDIGVKSYALDAGKKAVAEHLKRVGLEGTVSDSSFPSTYRVSYEIKGKPKVSILIPTCDHAETLKKCLDSIMNLSTYDNYEIVLVENNSRQSETFFYYETLMSYERVKLVSWNGEFNYSAINNFGFNYTSGEYVILLNNDIEVITPDWIQEMLMFAQRQDVGAVGAMLYYPSDRIQHAGVILGIGGVAGHSHKGTERGEGGYMSRLTLAQNLSAVTGACMMLPRRVYEELGGLDEGFKIAFNDVDLCMRIRKSGRLVVWTPYAELYHYESESRGYEDTPEKQARFESEVQKFKGRWGADLEKGDPYYNPNLTLEYEDFSVAEGKQ